IDHTGQVVADSARDGATKEIPPEGPEIQQAFASGEGQAVRRSATMGRDLVYRAVRYQEPDGSAVVIRMALPLVQAEISLAELRWRLYEASLVILLLGGLSSLIYF